MAGAAIPQTVNGGQAGASGHRAAVATLTGLFFMWGFITCLNDILIPHLKAVFELGYAEAMLIQLAFFAAYFIASLPSGKLVARIGYKAGIVGGLGTAALGCVLFYPAADARSYPLFLGALFVLACGITLLQVAANPLVAMLGRAETASSRLTTAQAFNSLGTTIAPAIGAALILSTAVAGADQMAAMTATEVEAYRAAEAASVQLPYLGLGAALVLIAVFFAFYRFPNLSSVTEPSSDAPATASVDGPRSAWAHMPLVFGAIAIFTYVGAEVAIGSFLVNFMAEPDIAGLTEAQAGGYLSIYWGGAMVGRFIGSVTLAKFPPRRVLMVHTVLAVVLVAVAISTSGSMAMWALLAVGLCNSIMFPTIFTLAIEGLGRHTSQGSGILCMAIVGGAVVPVVQGVLADSIGIQLAFVLPVICYAYIGWFAARGSRERRAAAVPAPLAAAA